MWRSHGKTNRAGFRVTLRVQPLSEQENRSLEAAPELYGRTLSRHSKSNASQGAQTDMCASIELQIFDNASERMSCSFLRYRSSLANKTSPVASGRSGCV